MTPEQYARALLMRLARHFGLSTIPNVRVGCDGCPYYDHVRRRCMLGYVACYSPETKTITFSSPRYINELVATHELMHYVLGIAGRAGYRIGFRPRGMDWYKAVTAASAVISSITSIVVLKTLLDTYKRKRG